jgi:hypothetical protein
MTEAIFREEPAVKARTNDNGKVSPPKPATSTEIITLTIEGRDYGNPPGDQSLRIRQEVANVFLARKQITNDSSIGLRGGLSASQTDPQDSSRSFVTFRLVCDFPPKTR